MAEGCKGIIIFHHINQYKVFLGVFCMKGYEDWMLIERWKEFEFLESPDKKGYIVGSDDSYAVTSLEYNELEEIKNSDIVIGKKIMRDKLSAFNVIDPKEIPNSVQEGLVKVVKRGFGKIKR